MTKEGFAKNKLNTDSQGNSKRQSLNPKPVTKVAIVTGGSGVLGKRIVTHLVNKGPWFTAPFHLSIGLLCFVLEVVLTWTNRAFIDIFGDC